MGQDKYAEVYEYKISIITHHSSDIEFLIEKIEDEFGLIMEHEGSWIKRVSTSVRPTEIIDQLNLRLVLYPHKRREEDKVTQYFHEKLPNQIKKVLKNHSNKQSHFDIKTDYLGVYN